MHRRTRLTRTRLVLFLALGFVLLASNAVVLPASAATAAGWNTVNTLPTPLNNQVALTDNNFLYIFGGTNSGHTAAVWSAPVNSGGVLGTWVAQPSMPAVLYNHSGVLQDGYAVILGGQSTGGTAKSNVYTAKVDSTAGTIGTWSATTALPQPLFDSAAVSDGGFVWNIGGFTTGDIAQTTVYVAQQSGATLGAWSTTSPLPVAAGEISASVFNGRIYVAGGRNTNGAGTGGGQTAVYDAQIGANGALGPWQTLTALPQPRWDVSGGIVDNYLWVIGGYNPVGTTVLPTDTVYRAPINADGTIGSWLALSPLPAPVAEHTVSVAQGYFFVAGAKTGGTSSSNAIYTAPTSGPWVMLSSYSVNAGASVTVSGTGYAAGEQISVAFNGSTMTTVTADSSGSFGLTTAGATFAVPASTPTGSYDVTATGQTSGLAGQVSLAVTGSGTATPTPTGTSTATPSPTATLTPSATPTLSPTPTDTLTPTPTPTATSTPQPGGDEWSSYLYDGLHHGYNAAFTGFGTYTAKNLKQTWKNTTGGSVVTNPAVVDIAGGAGTNCAGSQEPIAYVGAWNGYLYAIDANSGVLCWKTFLSKDIISPANSFCITQLGVTSAPTVATVPGIASPVVFAGGSDILFAVNAQTGVILWQTIVAGVPNNQFSGAYIWSSPTYAAATNTIYTSTGSFCDETSPVDGGVYALDATSGAIKASLPLKPANQPGDGVWGSPTLSADGNTLYIATGNTFDSSLAQACVTSDPLSCAIVALNATTLQVTDSWQATQAVQDDDFGDTPVLFPDGLADGHTWLAVGNKDGYLYVLDTTNLAAGPVWSKKMANGGGNPIKGIIAPTAYYPSTISNGPVSCTGVLYLASGNTTLAGTAYGGSISALCATDGTILWQQGTTGLVWAAPTLANGLVADQQGMTEEVRDWTTGQVLFSFNTGQNIYDAATFANGHLYFGANNHALYAFGLNAPWQPARTHGCTSTLICHPIFKRFS